MTRRVFDGVQKLLAEADATMADIAAGYAPALEETTGAPTMSRDGTSCAERGRDGALGGTADRA
jgi:hypothetical protein